MNRRDALQSIGIMSIAAITPAQLSLNMQNQLTRTIPSSGEKLPAIGLGTWQTFDAGESDEELSPLREVLRTLVSKGAKVVDSSPMYGRSERVVGSLSQQTNVNDKLFLATKVWTRGEKAGIQQMEKSFALLKRDRMDLMQVHNLVDWEIHLKTLRAWKEAGKIRYIGLTHYTDSMHEEIASIVSKNEIDFIQINYSIASRNAERRLLPAAQDNNVAVIINRPFEEGALFQRVKGQPIPEWSKEFGCESWGQFFLKYILANENVTCVIPGTSKVKHLVDNLGAGLGRLPDANEKKKMITIVS